MSKSRSMALLAFVLVAGTGLSCVKSDEADCGPGFAVCGGVCERIGTDSQNCGACGNVCPASQACVAGACVATCESSLRAPLTDAWGHAWDGLERPAASFTQARAACEAIGGRLPSASELYRVSAVKSGAVGDAHKTNPVWSLTPNGPAAAYTVRLSSGGAAPSAMTAANPYRCLCPAARPDAFTEGACFGPAGEGCAPLAGNARFNFDREDRPAMTKAAAIAECAFAGGDLPTAERLAAAAVGGLPNGSGSALHTADDTGRYHADAYTYCSSQICIPLFGCICLGYTTVAAVDDEYEALVSFSGTSPALTEGAVQTQRPFRCVGPAAPGAVAASVANGFREPGGERTIDAGPDNVATTYTSAIADCFREGGHLPTVTELAAMAEQGLPAGPSSGARLTADQGYLGYAITFDWSGAAYWPVDPDLAATTPTADGVAYLWSGTSITDVPNGDATGRPYRCLYYGVDPTIARPADAQCSGGCFEASPGSGTSVARPRMWFDATSRGGAAGDTYASAVAACAASGGRLASTRDLVEAIRNGLDNASGDAVVTSELARGPVARTLAWSGSVNPAFADTGSSSLGLAATNVKFRCMWTNEIR